MIILTALNAGLSNIDFLSIIAMIIFAGGLWLALELVRRFTSSNEDKKKQEDDSKW